jgi:hypothetical protein
LLEHAPHAFPRAEKNPTHIHAHHAFPVLERGLQDVAHMPDARIVDQNIKPTVLRRDGVEDSADLWLIGDVERQRDRDASLLDDAGAHTRGGLRLNIGDEDLCALRGEEAGDRLADP